ncbi:hypothetical protein POM88_023726 [Heracleum sosnowskyi]|uniref:Prephenate dehydratase domain-containing protein n=1 Tax=Heracleum sosnowskyi TaxID=360622 RepID=A0AAD8IJF2_9APIA|nr:hypothetical protein POM88_023726 [Heracleum sosnowskyi]
MPNVTLPDLDYVINAGGTELQNGLTRMQKNTNQNDMVQLGLVLNWAFRRVYFISGLTQLGPLSLRHLPATPNNSGRVKISYKGIPGTYSEDAVLLAYPQCETVPSDKFEDVFKV